MHRRIATAGLIAVLVSVSSIAGYFFLADAREPASPRIKATNVVLLRERIGQRITVYGRVARTSTSSRSKHQFLNFHGDALSVICLAEDVSKFDGGGPAALFKDEDVELTGTLELYRDTLQIKRDVRSLKLAQLSFRRWFCPCSSPSSSPRPGFRLLWICRKIGFRIQRSCSEQGSDPALFLVFFRGIGGNGGYVFDFEVHGQTVCF